MGSILRAAGLIRPARPAGFCPACRLSLSSRAARPGLSRPMLAALVVLVVAGCAWAVLIQQSRSMAEGDMGLGPIERFSTTWTVMMAAMMLPSALPVVVEFARTAEGRRRWQLATAVLPVTYLGIWLAFGVACYAVYMAAGMPWPSQAVVTGLALAVAGVYSLSPIRRASQARCSRLSALHGPLPFNPICGAVVVGARYGLSCVGCSAGVMVGMVLIGMSSLWWTVILAGVVFVYKLAPPRRMRGELVLALGLAALGAIYVALA